MTKQMKYMTDDGKIQVFVEGFYEGADAMYVNEDGEHYGYVAEVVDFYYIDNPDMYTCYCSDIEDYGYSCTEEFVTDNGIYFVAIETV